MPFRRVPNPIVHALWTNAFGTRQPTTRSEEEALPELKLNDMDDLGGAFPLDPDGFEPLALDPGKIKPSGKLPTVYTFEMLKDEVDRELNIADPHTDPTWRQLFDE